MPPSPEHPPLAHRGRQESYPLQPLSRRDTASTTSTTFSTSSTATSSSAATSASLAKDASSRALNRLRHPTQSNRPTQPTPTRRPRSWHQETPSERRKKEFENQLRKQVHQKNLYTDCGRHSNEWLFSGWGDLAKWALGKDNVGVREGQRRSEGEERGRSVRRED